MALRCLRGSVRQGARPPSDVAPGPGEAPVTKAALLGGRSWLPPEVVELLVGYVVIP
jgi:hypothetical protein